MANLLSKPSEGFFMAKKAMVEVIDRRISILQEEQSELPYGLDNDYRHRAIVVEIQTLEYTRNYIRNVLLWFSEYGP